MIVLDTSHTIRVTHAATLTTKPSWNVAYADSTSTTLAEAMTSFLETLTLNTAETLVASPGSGARLVRDIWGRNNDAIADTFVVDIYDGATAYFVCKVTLNSGDQIHIGDKIEVMDSNGNLKYTTGFANQSANTVFAGPTSGSAAQPTWRALVAADLSSNMVDSGLCEGRLTLTTGVPVTTSDVTGATTIYLTPYKGNRISLFTSSVWTLYNFTEKSLALGTLTSGLPYDVFAFDSGGAVALELLAWTNGTTRATALVLQDGVLCKSGVLTRRYLGTFYTTSTTTTEDSDANRYLWNYYNRARRRMKVTDTTSSWTYTSSTWRQARATATNQINFVVGYAEVYVDATASCMGEYSAAGDGGAIGICLDATNTTNSDIVSTIDQQVAATAADAARAEYRSQALAVGKHFLAWVEQNPANAGTITFFGAGVNSNISGLVGSIDA